MILARLQEILGAQLVQQVQGSTTQPTGGPRSTSAPPDSASRGAKQPGQQPPGRAAAHPSRLSSASPALAGGGPATAGLPTKAQKLAKINSGKLTGGARALTSAGKASAGGGTTPAGTDIQEPDPGTLMLQPTAPWVQTSVPRLLLLGLPFIHGWPAFHHTGAATRG
jgi:hypothetical protein